MTVYEEANASMIQIFDELTGLSGELSDIYLKELLPSSIRVFHNALDQVNLENIIVSEQEKRIIDRTLDIVNIYFRDEMDSSK